MFRVIPFVKLQNDLTVKQLKTMKNEMRSKVTYLFWLNYVVFYPVLGRIWRDDDV